MAARAASMTIVPLEPVRRSESAAWARRALAGGVYLMWLLATWLFEKRVNLFTRYDPAGRALYALLANVAIGTVIAGVGARATLRAGQPVPWRTRPLLLALTAAVGGLVVTRAAPPAAREPLVLVNAFAQILPTSIAEVVVCWLLVGGAAREAAKRLGPVPATLIAVVVADVFFAVYHVAHSPPFDRPEMMAFLAIPGAVTGVLVFVVRDRAVAILGQNLFAMIGITRSADVGVFRHPFVWAYAVAIVAALAAFLALRPAGPRAS